MASQEQHINQWRHNRSLISRIPLEYPDWIATVAFYTAIQAVDALLTSKNDKVTSHDERNSILMRTHNYEKIWKHYSQLYNLSRTVRYLADPKKWIPSSSVMDK